MQFRTQEVQPEHAHIPCAKYPDLFAYHLGISGEGGHAHNWQDKPHRLVYDLTRIATEHREEIEQLRAELATVKQKNKELLTAIEEGLELQATLPIATVKQQRDELQAYVTSLETSRGYLIETQAAKIVELKQQRDKLVGAAEAVLSADEAENDHAYYRALDAIRAALAKVKP